MKRIVKMCRSLVLMLIMVGALSFFVYGVFAANNISYTVGGSIDYDVPAKITANMGGGGHNL